MAHGVFKKRIQKVTEKRWYTLELIPDSLSQATDECSDGTYRAKMM
jgi:hypothetical protein